MELHGKKGTFFITGEVFPLDISLLMGAECCYVDCQEENTSPPRLYICECWKSTNQAAIRGLKPHEIFSLNASRCRTLKYEVF